MNTPRPFDPEAILQVLARHRVEHVLIGGLAATLYGSPHVTTDVDITPSRSPANLERLAAALQELEAKIRAEGEPGGLPFTASTERLESTTLLNLTTRFGDLDLAFEPAGTHGYRDLRRQAVELELETVSFQIASLADVIRSKRAAGRDKDRLALPTLERLLERLGERGQGLLV